MKTQHYLLSIAMFLCTLQAYSQSESLLKHQFGNELIRVASIQPEDNRKTNLIVIVDEDFSKLTAGSEESPDTEPLLDEKGDIKDESLFNTYDETCTKPWGGYAMYAAGGCLAVKNGGFVNTPTGDYSGKLRMTCRIRLISGQSSLSNTDLDIILLRRSVLTDFKRVTIKLTEEWQNITFEADNGWFSDCMIQFFTMENFDYLIDDIYIEHTVNSIEPPKAQEPVTQGDYAFIAKWTPTDTADEYLLSVFSKKENPEKDFLFEEFDEISSMNDGTHINEMNANMPEGWDINLVQYGNKQHLFCEEGYFSSGKQSLCLDDPKDYIETKRLKYPIKQVRFWLKVDDREMPFDTYSSSIMSVQALTDTGWSDWVYISVEAARKLSGKDNVIDITEHIGDINDIYAIRLSYDKADGDKCILAIDDVDIVSPGTPINEFLFEDKVIPGRSTDSYHVTVSDRDKTYFYHVKARNSNFTSATSQEIEVYDVHDPEALPATDITANAYTANWDCGSKADYFLINQRITKKADKDYPEYIVIEEDFSKVKSYGTPENPENSEPSEGYVSIDEYTQIPGWSAISMLKADGMLGGTSEVYPYSAGAIRLPKMDLSNNDGNCEVTLRVYGQAGDYILIQGVGTTTLNSIYFEETGMQEAVLPMQFCTSEEQFTIYSGSYSPFLVDYVKVTQSVKQGDAICITTGAIEVQDPNARFSRIENVQFVPGYELQYNLSAFRLRNGNPNDIWQSWPSDYITVTPTTTIIPTKKNENSCITTSRGTINVSLDQSDIIRIYDLTGRIVKTVNCPSGKSTIAIPPAIYVVNINNITTKISTY